MNSFLQSMSAASSAMNVQSFRMRVISENVANSETPGYRAKNLTFDNVYNRDTGANQLQVGKIDLSDTPLPRKYDPAHPLADAESYVEMSNVKVMVEMADGREAGRSYEANLATFQQARQMYSSLMDMLKR